MKKWLKPIIDIATEEGWNTNWEDNNGAIIAEFSQRSPAGEDFSFTSQGNSERELIQDVMEYAYNFSIDEHIEMWLGAKANGTSGVPSVSVLCKDAEAIHEMLRDLGAILRENEYNKEKKG